MSTTTAPTCRRRGTRSAAAPAPIRPIRTEADYDRAAAELDELVLRDDLARDEQDRMEVLTALIAHYDDAHYPLAADDRPLPERLRSLMASAGVTPAQLGDIIGSRPAASMALSGKRELSKSHIRRLAAHFKMSPAYFI